ncbi:ComEC/Rec2 family competence protein [Terriglobus saanensis]|uniref:Metallo-beta-lactamase domain-containing protein n=1 Tax=Terriglobus saanensis (strain ATCC BAA-1853 / DSM 23119 / SP1PR4) TaxID=401053 RepID=E8V2W7_TERSS|nr:MBL fold metallo-hydrolase [Terriglobus saanensis]ADV84664.1 hypothetical protein AciPR4_3915 [Terriglobus saanensis SP1PR4]
MRISAGIDRRVMLKSFAAAALVGGVMRADTGREIGSPLPSRREGELDLHHIDTGRGNCTLIVGPDGTTMMIDAGASAVGSPNAAVATSSEARPDASRRAGEWQARYALQHSASAKLDYMVVTHVHPDHVGDVSTETPLAASGGFHLTGVSDVDALMPITTLLDRGYPEYAPFAPPPGAFTTNYIAYLKHRVETARAVEKVKVGSTEQVKLRSSEKYPEFAVRMLSANGVIWNGKGDGTHTDFPAAQNLAPEDRPNENLSSVALRLSYGKFSYFAGGDLSSDTHDGRVPWQDVESPVTKAAGRTEVAAADHHGYFDACGPEFVRNLDAQAYIVQAWDVGHAGAMQLQRMLGAWGRGATHDVFALDVLPANELMNRRFTPLLKSRRGHVVVRVATGGGSYRILVVDSAVENGGVRAVFGPYTCRG